MTIHYWNNHKIEVKSHALSRYFWCAISLSVKVDNNKIFNPSNDKLALRDSFEFLIENDKENIVGKITSLAPASALYTRYKIFIDNNEFATGNTRADNWFILYGIAFILFISSFLLFLRN